MIYRRKASRTYPGRGVVLAIQALLIVGIAYFGIEALGNIFTRSMQPAYELVVSTSLDTGDYRYEQRRSAEDWADYYHNLGVYYLYDAGIPSRALAQFKSAEALTPNDPAVFLGQGVAYEHMGMPQQAADLFLSWMQGVQTCAHSVAWESGEATSLTMSEGRLYLFTINASAGDVLDVSANSVIPGEVDPLVIVIDGSGQAIYGADDMLDGKYVVSMDSAIEDLMLEAGRYTVVVGHAGGGSYGDLDVTVNVE